MSPPILTAASQSLLSDGRNSAQPAVTPPRGQSAVPVSVLKRSPPTVTATLPGKGAIGRMERERQEENEDPDEEDEDVEVVEVKQTKEEEDVDVEVLCDQTFNRQSAKQIEDEHYDDDDDNGVMEVDDESGAEDKEKDLLR